MQRTEHYVSNDVLLDVGFAQRSLMTWRENLLHNRERIIHNGGELNGKPSSTGYFNIRY